MLEFFKGTVTPKDIMAVSVIIGLLLVLIVVYGFVLHKKQVDNLNIEIAQNDQIKADLQFAQKTEKEFGELQKEMEKTENLVRTFEERLPLEREIPTLVRQFEGLGDEVGVNPNLKSAKRIKSGNKETIPYEITVYGRFHQIVSFINRLERFQRYVKISNLSMGPETEGICEAKFTLSTYRFIQSMQGGAS